MLTGRIEDARLWPSKLGSKHASLQSEHSPFSPFGLSILNSLMVFIISGRFWPCTQLEKYLKSAPRCSLLIYLILLCDPLNLEFRIEILMDTI